MNAVGEFQIRALSDQVRVIEETFENFKFPYRSTEKNEHKKTLDERIPYFWKSFHAFSDEFEMSPVVEEMRLRVNRIQAALSMNLPSTTDKPSGKDRLNIVS